MRPIFKTILCFIVALTISDILRAGGTNFTPIFGARALSLNGLYIAGVDGLNCTWTNPAGFAFLTGSEINASVLDRMEQQEFESPASGLHRSYRNDNFSLAGGLYYNLRPGLTVALAYNKLINYSVDWPYAFYRRSDSLTAIAGFDFNNNIQVSAISPSVSFLLGSVAIGLTLDAYYVSQSSAFPVNNSAWASGRGLVAYQFAYDQNAWAFGFNAGIMAELSDNFRLGLSARSSMKASLKGSAQSQMFSQLNSAASNVNISGDFKLPWVFGLGAIYKLNTDLSLNIDASYSLWKNIKTNFIYNFDNPIWQQSLSSFDSLTGFQGSNFQFVTKNTLDAGFGLEYGLLEQGFTYRLGYRYSQSPLENSSYSLLFPGVDQHWFSIGVGYKGEDFYVDAVLSYVLGVSKNVNRSGLPDLSGTYRMNNVVPAVTLHFAL